MSKHPTRSDGFKRHPVTWLVIKKQSDQRDAGIFGDYGFIGFCGREGRCAFLVTFKRPVALKDMEVDESRRECEAAEGCLALACPLNRTTYRTWMKGRRLNITKEAFDRLVREATKVKVIESDRVPEYDPRPR